MKDNTISTTPTRPVRAERPQVTRYDQVSSLLIALLVVLSVLVGGMLLLVVSVRMADPPLAAVPVQFVEGPGGRGDHDAGTARDAFRGQVDEIDEFFPPDTDEGIETLGQVLATDVLTPSSLDAPLTPGRGKGLGDSRRPGPLGEGMGEAATVPRWERWQVRFSAADLEAYARQLDYFGIELAAMGGGQANVDYASQLSRPRPLRRAGRSQDEQRLYMTWRSGELIEADRQLLAKAGIATADRVILQFYPPQAEAMLASLERQEAGEKDLRSIRRTVFGVRPKGRQFEFFVISQDHWDAP